MDFFFRGGELGLGFRGNFSRSRVCLSGLQRRLPLQAGDFVGPVGLLIVLGCQCVEVINEIDLVQVDLAGQPTSSYPQGSSLPLFSEVELRGVRTF